MVMTTTVRYPVPGSRPGSLVRPRQRRISGWFGPIDRSQDELLDVQSPRTCRGLLKIGNTFQHRSDI